MKNFIGMGNRVTLTAAAVATSGQPVLIGSLFGIAENAAAIGEPLVLLMGTAHRAAAALHLPARAAKPPRGGNPAEFQRSGSGVQVKNRPWACHRADLPPRAAGQATQTAEPGRSGARG